MERKAGLGPLMRRFVLLGTMLVVTAACAPSGSSAGRSTPAQDSAVVAEAEATIASFFDAMRAGDADAVLSYYTDGPFHRISCTEVQDQSFFRQVTGDFYRTREGLEFNYEVVDARAVGSDGAVVMANGDFEGSPLFWTWVLAREGDGLRIVAEHESWAGCPEPRVRFHGGDMELPPDSQ